MDLLEVLCAQTLVVMNATVAAVFRSIDEENPPTLLVDEADTIFAKGRSDTNTEDLGAVQYGVRPGPARVAVRGTEPRPDRVPDVRNGGVRGDRNLPDTIEDRSPGPIQMRRRAPNEIVSPYRRRRDRQTLENLHIDLAAWVADVVDDLEKRSRIFRSRTEPLTRGSRSLPSLTPRAEPGRHTHGTRATASPPQPTTPRANRASA